ncbi:hypothetical protein [Streptomyces sp. NPDC003480]
MANPTSRIHGTGSPARRAGTAPAERGARQEEHTPSGRTLFVEPPANGWEDPPEPESFEGEPEDGAPPRNAGRSVLTAVLGSALVAALVAATVLEWH